MNSKFNIPLDSAWFAEGSGWPDEVPKNMEFSEKTVDSIIRDAANRWPKRKAAVFLGTAINYAQYDKYIDSMATALHQLGIKKGETVALLLPNSIQYLISYYAVMRIGAIVSGINPTYKPMEIKHQLEVVHAKYLIFLDVLYEDKVAPIRHEFSFKYLIGTNIGDFLPWHKKKLGSLLKKIPSAPLPYEALKFSDLLKTKPEPPTIEIDPLTHPASYIMTGGTTGIPKAAILTHFNIYCNAIQARCWFYKAKPGIANLGILPFFHAFGMTAILNITPTFGGYIHLFPKPPKMPELFDTIQNECPDNGTLFIGAEILFKKFAEFEDGKKYNISNKLMLSLSGAGPLHKNIQEKYEDVTQSPLAEGYGLTEASPVVSVNPLWCSKEMRTGGFIGLPLPGTQWKIVDKTDYSRVLGIGDSPEDKDKIGELVVCGPQIMAGYLDNEQETSAHIYEEDGKKWLLTGDIGYMNKFGQVTILDRKKELIKYKGYSVFPKDVENLIGQHKAVNEIAVAGLPDPEVNEIIKAWIVLEKDMKEEITPEELITWCKENITHYKVPRQIEFIDEIPKNLVGKVLRRILKENDPIWIEMYGKD
jgi:long-chain acyl-CoA synthetase